MGRKAKKGDFLDLDEPEGPEQAQPAEEEPVNASKPKGKKGKKGKAAAFADGAFRRQPCHSYDTRVSTTRMHGAQAGCTQSAGCLTAVMRAHAAFFTHKQ